MLSQLLMIVWVSHLEELEQHVIKVGGDVHNAYGWVLLTCGDTESLSLLPHLKMLIFKHRVWVHQEQLLLFRGGSVNIALGT